TINMLTRQPKDRGAGGDDNRGEVRDEARSHLDIDSQIEREYQRQLFRRAAEIVRSRADPATWQAFAVTMIDGRSIAEAAAQLDRSEAVIYAARSRVMRRLRDTVKALEDESDERSS